MDRKTAATCQAIFVSSCCWAASGADWFSVRHDSQQSAFQRDEKTLGIRNVGRLRLLWNLKLSRAGEMLSDPIMLGPIITERGVKELVFVRDSTSVYSVDADLGRVFWNRTIDPEKGNRSSGVCTARLAPPVLHSLAAEAEAISATDESYADGNRPLYVIGDDGKVRVLRPRTGKDLMPSFQLAPVAARAVSLQEKDGNLYAIAAPSCKEVPDQVWLRQVGNSGLQVGSEPKGAAFKEASALASFDWKGKSINIGITSGGQISFESESTGSVIFGKPQDSKGLATGLDSVGRRWIFVSGSESISGFQVTDHNGQPEAVSIWTMSGMRNCRAPVLANGVVYFLTRVGDDNSKRTVLHAVDAQKGIELYQSTDGIPDDAATGNLAFANGHVCFSVSGGSLACFGIPFTM